MSIIDVSKHNGTIDWGAVKRSGKVEGAIIRCGYGSDLKNQDDLRFKEYMEGCIANGIPVGVYLYSYATNLSQVDSEVRHTLRLIDPYKDKLVYPVYFDTEEKGTQSFSAQAARRYCAAIEDAGYKVGIYASLSWWRNYLKGVDAWPKWVAAWTGTKPSIDGMAMWQYTDKGSVPGIRGSVDLSYSYSTGGLSLRGHVQGIGWQDWVGAGAVCGTTEQSRRLEAVQFSKDSGITAQAHCQGYGDMAPVAPGGICGTTGESKRMEAIKLDCKDVLMYRVHVQASGWTPWVSNGMWCGTKGQSLRLEAIQVKKA